MCCAMLAVLSISVTFLFKFFDSVFEQQYRTAVEMRVFEIFDLILLLVL